MSEQDGGEAAPFLPRSLQSAGAGIHEARQSHRPPTLPHPAAHPGSPAASQKPPRGPLIRTGSHNERARKDRGECKGHAWPPPLPWPCLRRHRELHAVPLPCCPNSRSFGTAVPLPARRKLRRRWRGRRRTRCVRSTAVWLAYKGSFRPSPFPPAAEPAPITHSHCPQATAGHLGMLKVRAAPRHGDWAFWGTLGAPAQCRGTTTEVEQQSS